MVLQQQQQPQQDLAQCYLGREPENIIVISDDDDGSSSSSTVISEHDDSSSSSSNFSMHFSPENTNFSVHFGQPDQCQEDSGDISEVSISDLESEPDGESEGLSSDLYITSGSEPEDLTEDEAESSFNEELHILQLNDEVQIVRALIMEGDPHTL